LNLQQQQHPERGQVIGHLIVFSHQVRCWRGPKVRKLRVQSGWPKRNMIRTLCMHDRPSHPQIHTSLLFDDTMIIHPSHIPQAAISHPIWYIPHPPEWERDRLQSASRLFGILRKSGA